MTTQAPSFGEFAPESAREPMLVQLREPLLDGALPPPAAQLYKGGSDQWFVTYELGLDDDEGCPQVIRVYLSGELRRWEIGTFTSRSGAPVHGVKIEYERTHDSYRLRQERGEFATDARCFAKIIELPPGATQVRLRAALPDRYRHALHRF